MKKLFPLTFLLLLSIAAWAQKDVTRFLGIPVDGSKSEMIRKLKEKGFRSSSYDSDILNGEFNGYRVKVHVVTNNNKVYRILVADAYPVNETAIRIRFNHLCQQFANNSRYTALQDDYTIPEDEKISYEILVNKKRYEAVFYQQPAADSAAITQELKSILLSKYTEEQIANATDEMRSDMFKMSFEYMMERYSKKSVWFMIKESSYGEYSILMYYDNEYNRADGEDL